MKNYTQIQAHYIKSLLDILTELGVTEQQILARLGLSSEQILEQSFDADPDANVLMSLLALSGDEQLGLRMGARMNLLSQGVYGLALMSSATLGDALKLLLRYNTSIFPQITMELNQRAEGMELIIPPGSYPNAVERFFCEVMFSAVLYHGALLSQGGALLDQSLTGVVVELDYQPTMNLDLYEETLGSSIVFNASRCALYFDSEGLAQPISTANPVAGSLFLRECDRLFETGSGQGRLSERVQQLLLRSASSFPGTAAVAEQLHMSERTLQRRLLLEGVRYQQLLDGVRYRLAREYLLGTELPVVAIAELLGFSDAANFRRSFKRWANLTPAQLRSDARAEH